MTKDFQYLENMFATSCDDFKSSVRCREINGNPLTVEECEHLLERTGSKTLSKFLQSKAKQAFKRIADAEVLDDEQAERIASGTDDSENVPNYKTLRRAMYLAGSRSALRCASIRAEIMVKYPWGNCR